VLEFKNRMTTDIMTMSSNNVFAMMQQQIQEVEKNEPMTGKIKYDLREKINGLTPFDHLNIIKLILKYAEKKVYTTTNSGTFFDLNDLDNRTLWRLEKFISLTLSQIEQEREMEKVEHEKKINELATKNRGSAKKPTEQTLIPRNKATTKPRPNNIIYEEIMTNPKSGPIPTVQEARDFPYGSGHVSSPNQMQGSINSFFAGSTKTSVNTTQPTETIALTSAAVSGSLKANSLFSKTSEGSLIGGAPCITDDDLTADCNEGGEVEHDDLETDDDNDDDEDEEDEEEDVVMDPSQIIRNGGREYVDED
jgi:hypothetical protein